MRLSKKAEDNIIREYIIFIIFSLLFFVAAFIFVGKLGKSAGIYEEMCAKKIALAIDAAKPGMEISINIAELYDYSKNPLVNIGKNDKGVNRVEVSLRNGRGYSYSYFSDYNVARTIDNNLKYIIIKVEEKK